MHVKSSSGKIFSSSILTDQKKFSRLEIPKLFSILDFVETLCLIGKKHSNFAMLAKYLGNNTFNPSPNLPSHQCLTDYKHPMCKYKKELFW